jgi:hypothetical protein
MQEWLADESTWEDVYSKKPLDYLQGVADGFEPKWSTQLKKYVWGNQEEEALELSSTSSAQKFLQEDEEEVGAETYDADSDDLPF